MNKNSRQEAEALLSFIRKSPTAFQAAAQLKERFLAEGFTELKEKDRWKIERGKSYVVTRNSSALIAFTIPEEGSLRFHIMAGHSDSPTFKIKENPEICVEAAYTKLNVEKYGGVLMSTWFDRPLSVAGRILTEENGEICEHLISLDKDLLVIPNLAIHMNREVNDGYVYNVQKDLLPLYASGEKKGSFLSMIAKEAGVNEEDILGHDLFLYNREQGSVWGPEGEFVSAPRLDDLECVYASMEGYLKGKKEKNIAVYCVLDNEEVGSTTRQGAASTFLKDTLMRLCMGRGEDKEAYMMALAQSFMLSMDNAHALHPNYPDKADPVNRPVINGGIVLKFNANQKYCTDAVSGAAFKALCKKADVPVQVFVNRSDLIGGSTLGNIANSHTAMVTADIGLAQLAMHSCYETAGVEDLSIMIKASEEFFV